MELFSCAIGIINCQGAGVTTSVVAPKVNQFKGRENMSNELLLYTHQVTQDEVLIL